MGVLVSQTALYGLLPVRISLEAMSPRRVAVLIALGLLIGTLTVWAVSALIVIPSLRNHGKCPYCRSLRIRGAWPRLSDHALPWLRAFRCEACLRRFYLLRRFEKRQRVPG